MVRHQNEHIEAVVILLHPFGQSIKKALTIFIPFYLLDNDPPNAQEKGKRSSTVLLSRSDGCSARVQSVFPVVWVAMQVHYGEDEYAMRLDTVKHAIRKTMNETSTDLVFCFGPHGGIIDSILNRGVNLAREVESESYLAVLIVCNGIYEFILCFRMEGVFHIANR